MKKTPKNFKFNKLNVLGLVCFICITTVMCHRQEQQDKIKKLDNQIANLDKKIYQSRDIRTAPVPEKLRGTQKRYNTIVDSIQTISDSLDMYAAYNDSLISRAFNNYAMRIGQDFQLSQFLSAGDISIFQKHIANLDTMDFVKESARQRILHNAGSLNDLSYFLEMLDYDSVNQKLSNKLAWDFVMDTTANDIDTVNLIPVLNFDTTNTNGAIINNALIREQNLLNIAFVKPDTTAHHVPEIDSVYKNPLYRHNDSVLKNENNTMQHAIDIEDSLLDYNKTLQMQRDSLIRKRNALIK